MSAPAEIAARLTDGQLAVLDAMTCNGPLADHDAARSLDAAGLVSIRWGVTVLTDLGKSVVEAITEKRAERSAYYRAMGAANPPGAVIDTISVRAESVDYGAGRSSNISRRVY